VTIVDAEELGGAMTEKLAELFDENPPPETHHPVRKPDAWSRASARFLDPADHRTATVSGGASRGGR
jgi:hypothetical protein